MPLKQSTERNYLKKLWKYSFRKNVLLRSSDYLKNKKQKVWCETIEFEVYDINTEILQDSILWPIIFVLYINDLPKIIKLCKLIC